MHIKIYSSMLQPFFPKKRIRQEFSILAVVITKPWPHYIGRATKYFHDKQQQPSRVFFSLLLPLFLYYLRQLPIAPHHGPSRELETEIAGLGCLGGLLKGLQASALLSLSILQFLSFSLRSVIICYSFSFLHHDRFKKLFLLP